MSGVDLMADAGLRRPAPVRRRRRSQLFRLVTGAAHEAFVLVGAPIAGAIWVAGSSAFAVDEITVNTLRSEAGAEPRVAPQWIGEQLEPLRGAHVLGISLGEIRGRLEGHPWVAAVTISKRLPNRVEVTVAERRPVALGRAEAGFVYLDAAGRRIAPAPAEERGRWLVVDAPAETVVPVEATLAVVEAIEGLRPAWEGGVEEVEILGGSDFALRIPHLGFELLVVAEDVEGQLGRLAAALAAVPAAERDRIVSADLRFARRVVITRGEEKAPSASASEFSSQQEVRPHAET